MKRDWLFDPAEAHQFSPYRPVRFAFHSDYSVSPLNNKISRLYHLVTPLPRCLRFTANITVYSTRLAIGGWLNLSEQDSHLFDYPPFVWAHNQNLSIYPFLYFFLDFIQFATGQKRNQCVYLVNTLVPPFEAKQEFNQRIIKTFS